MRMLLGALREAKLSGSAPVVLRLSEHPHEAAMILESAILNVRPGQEAAFEAAMARAQPLIAATPGFLSLRLHRCVETPGRYLLLVEWRALEDHVIGFRKSDRYQEWRALLHRFYDPFPVVEHFGETLL